MLVGYAPFCSDTPSETCQKILKWEKYFHIPPEANLSQQAIHLIKSLVSPADRRLGLNGAEEIKKHPFFKNFDWKNVLKMKAPFVPVLKNEWDTEYFDKFEETESFYPDTKPKVKNIRKEVDFVNFTYKAGQDKLKNGVIQALEVLETIKNARNKQSEEPKEKQKEQISAGEKENYETEIINNTQKKKINIPLSTIDSTINPTTRTTKELVPSKDKSPKLKIPVKPQVNMISVKKINIAGKSLSPPKSTNSITNQVNGVNKTNASPKIGSRYSEKIYNDIKVKINSVSPRHKDK